jgi:hypothetical protein
MKNKQNDPQKPVAAGMIPVSQLALLLMVTDRWVRQLQRIGYIPRSENGRVSLVAGVQGYLRHRADARERAAETEAEASLRDARARALELRLAREETQLIPDDEAVAFVRMIVDETMSGMSKLPAQFTRDPDERRRMAGLFDAIKAKAYETIAEHMPSAARFRTR